MKQAKEEEKKNAEKDHRLKRTIIKIFTNKLGRKEVEERENQ